MRSDGIHILSGLIEDAYQNEVDDFEFPQAARTGRFAVSVLIPPNTTVRTCRQMLQKLLTERFHLKTDVETRQVARYYLKVAKSGLKMKPVNPPADASASYSFDVKDGNVRYVYRGAPMSRILISIRGHAALNARARGLQATGSVNDPSFRLAAVDSVVDETGLTGSYDGAYEFAPAASLRSEFSESLSDALTRQLGLTLELRRAPGKVLVIRSADRTPTEN